MSHTTKRKSAIKNADFLKKAIARIPGAEYLGIGQGRTYSGTNSGHIVKLPGWNYNVTIDVNTGECTYDNYGGRWGDEATLDKLTQGYAVEAAKAQAATEGREVEECVLEDGSIKLVIPIGGGYETAADGGTDSSGWGV